MLVYIYIYKHNENFGFVGRLVGWLVGFYGISTLVSYLESNRVYTY